MFQLTTEELSLAPSMASILVPAHYKVALAQQAQAAEAAAQLASMSLPPFESGTINTIAGIVGLVEPPITISETEKVK